ncbi:dynein regulatory complex protein 11 [Corythoichthys intestinalis]|uniref:dynein regulatory complex protein 11 n=1 Tax=Corythoichthys intestinalis TaxID=161448 RepID=UPI0025A6064D|nr:dynein regulatory complex protein 11 [Corythoichthys intestinalis]XP_057696696.1 dynein regulatory complex protein 11 [Corythoichthys intestinalis]XP_057696697.1 dynein regulatory complex protein 11 [Corythoichthys intestinalis]XP_061791024.1 dynein regulatory complex protein 11-like [Nerophis lumbriciformis]
MSQRTYNELWAEAQVELSRLLVEELPAEPLKPEKDRVVFFQRLATLYVRYLQILRQLEKVYDQAVHPQKRRLVLTTLEAVMGRLLELKNEMVDKELCEYHYMDDVLHDLKLTPADLEIPIPYYFLSERNEDNLARRAMLTNILEKMEATVTEKRVTKPMSQDEAIRIIQVAERARQGRLRAALNEASKRLSKIPMAAAPQPADMARAAVRIQKVWRGYVERKKTKAARIEDMIFLGMAPHPKYQSPIQAKIDAHATEEAIRNKQKEHEDEYQKSVIAIASHLLEVEGHDIAVNMKEQIRQWFLECRNLTGVFPEFPDDDEGGSAILFAEKDYQQLLKEMAEAEDDGKNKKEKQPEKKDAKKAKGKEEEEEGLEMLPSNFLADLELCNKTFVDFWETRTESRNFDQRHEVELIKEEKRVDVLSEIRVKVDEDMRQELADWRLAVEKTPAKIYKKKKPKRDKKKKKGEKDLTVNRTLESLCQEMVEEGLLKQSNPVRMQDYLGDFNYLGTTLRMNDIEPMPSMSDVRQLLSLYAILPLGSQIVHEKAPLTKAILLAGPVGVGKRMLVNAICTETGATLFDLSPVNIAGKYPGKSGLSMMLHLVFKVARLLQPSVIWIDGAEKMFYKKIPKEERALEPKRLKKDLPKSLKLIKEEDRVLVIGTSKDPTTADIKSLCKMYTKVILIPRPDYGSRYVLWKQLIQKHGGEITSALDLSSLSKISDGYTAGNMIQAIQQVITKRRLLLQEKRPLTAVEFVAPLAKFTPVFQDQEEALKKWYAKTPLGKKRIKAAQEREEALQAQQANKGKGKGKGKDAPKKGKK